MSVEVLSHPGQLKLDLFVWSWRLKNRRSLLGGRPNVFTTTRTDPVALSQPFSRWFTPALFLACCSVTNHLDLSGLSVPRVRTVHGEVALSFHTPHIWKKLPEKCRPSPTLSASKSKLKTLFVTAFHYINCLALFSLSWSLQFELLVNVFLILPFLSYSLLILHGLFSIKSILVWFWSTFSCCLADACSFTGQNPPSPMSSCRLLYRMSSVQRGLLSRRASQTATLQPPLSFRLYSTVAGNGESQGRRFNDAESARHKQTQRGLKKVKSVF